jgi:TetR/AcrR family transcriptional regulator
MEKFFNLPVEKQNTIIDAALNTFGSNGYKKASISDIATAAGISKAMIFHYFGTKKDLYFYLINMCGTLITDEVNAKFDNSVTDFFGRISMASEIEINVIKKHPALISFLKSVYFEKNEEVVDDIKALLAQGDGFRNKIAFENMDYSRFKDGVDVRLVMKMLMWMTDGFMNSIRDNSGTDFDSWYQEFSECFNLLKNNLYKDEYL